VQFTVDQGWIEAVVLASLRIVAFVIVAPPFSYHSIPVRVKAILGVGLAVAVVPTVAAGKPPLEVGPFIAAACMEVVTGLALGFLVMVVFSAVSAAGGLLDLFGGLQLAEGYDPGMQINGATFSRMFQIAALALLFATDGYQLVLLGLVRSFGAVPLGGALDLSHPAQALIQSVGQMLVSALQIAGPLLVVLFLADVGLGLLTRVAPALNAFAMGFPLKILLLLLFVGTVFVVLPSIVSALTGQAVGLISGVVG